MNLSVSSSGCGKSNNREWLPAPVQLQSFLTACGWTWVGSKDVVARYRAPAGDLDGLTVPVPISRNIPDYASMVSRFVEVVGSAMKLSSWAIVAGIAAQPERVNGSATEPTVASVRWSCIGDDTWVCCWRARSVDIEDEAVACIPEIRVRASGSGGALSYHAVVGGRYDEMPFSTLARAQNHALHVAAGQLRRAAGVLEVDGA